MIDVMEYRASLSEKDQAVFDAAIIKRLETVKTDQISRLISSGFKFEDDDKTFPFKTYKLVDFPKQPFVFNGVAVSIDNGNKSIRKSIIFSIFNYGHDVMFGQNAQKVETPEKIADEMVSIAIADEIKSQCSFQVWFNLEFLEVLIHKKDILKKQITFLTDSIIKAKWAHILYGVDSYWVPNFKFYETIQDYTIMPKSNNLIVIGNPPYQVQDAGESINASPIYHKFVDTAIQYINAKKVCMIIPSKWMFGGKGLSEFRTRMMNDSHLSKVVHFPGIRDVFRTVQNNGGVNYFLWDRTYSGPCEFTDPSGTTKRYLNRFKDIIVMDNRALPIIEKIVTKSNKFISDSVYGTLPFGLTTNFHNLPGGTIPCYCVGKTIQHVSPEIFSDKHGILKKYKVCMSKADSFFSTGKYTHDTPFVINPDEICTQTYICVKSFDDLNSANNFIHYMKTKFFRFFLRIKVMTMDVNKEKFAYVPDIEDYSKQYSDSDLFTKFGLSDEECSYITTIMKDC